MSLCSRYRVAAIVPCRNNEGAVGKVVADLLTVVPGLTVHVYDAGSSDRTVEHARTAGAVVSVEPMGLKRDVVRRAFAEIDADVYVLMDGNGAYDAATVPRLIERLVSENLDHVVGVRDEASALGGLLSPVEVTEQRVLDKLTKFLFGHATGDVLSGCRVLSNRYVKSFSGAPCALPIEAHLTVHTLALRIPSASVPIPYQGPPGADASQARNDRGSRHVLGLIVGLARHERPMVFFGLLALASAAACAAVAAAPTLAHFSTGAEPHAFTLITVGLFMLLATSFLLSGTVLDGVRRWRHENQRLTYMGFSPVSDAADVAQTAVELVVQPTAQPRRTALIDSAEWTARRIDGRTL